MRNDDLPSIDDEDYFGLLDILVVLAEWWILIVATLVVVGGASYLALSSREPTYVAVAIADLSRLNEGVLRSEAVAERIADRAGLASHAELSQVMSITSEGPAASRIEVHTSTSKQASEIMSAVLDEMVTLGQPTEVQRKLFEERVDVLDKAIQQRERYLEQLSQLGDAVAGDVASAVVLVLRDIEALREQRRKEEERLVRFDRSDVLAEAQYEVARRGTLKWAAVGAGAAGFFVLAFGIARELWRRSRLDPINKPKIDRIRRSFAI